MKIYTCTPKACRIMAVLGHQVHLLFGFMYGYIGLTLEYLGLKVPDSVGKSVNKKRQRTWTPGLYGALPRL